MWRKVSYLQMQARCDPWSRLAPGEWPAFSFQLWAAASCNKLLSCPHLNFNFMTISILRAHCWQVDTIGHPRRFHSTQFHLFWHRDARPRISTFPDSTTQYAANFYSVSIEIHQITRECACALKWYISSMCRVRNLNMANNVLLVRFFSCWSWPATFQC